MPLNDILIEVVEGPKGKAELHEVQESLSSIVYEVRYEGEAETFESIGEAYLVAGEKVGAEVEARTDIVLLLETRVPASRGQ